VKEAVLIIALSVRFLRPPSVIYNQMFVH